MEFVSCHAASGTWDSEMASGFLENLRTPTENHNSDTAMRT